MTFSDKLNAAIARNQSLLFLGLDPNPEMMPCLNSNRTEENIIGDLWDWLQFSIAQTKDLVCAYKPTLGFYQALGAPGIELLKQTLQAIPEDIPIILDAKHSDLNSSTIFAQTVFERWQVDAVTLSPYPGQDCIAPFLVYPGKAVFVLCCTSNPGAIALQQYPSPDAPFYLQIVRETKSWGTPEQVCLEVGTTSPEVLAKIRAITPERTIMVRSIWAEASKLPQLLAAGLNSHGSGLLVPIPQDLMSQKHQDLMSQKHPASQIQALRQEIEQARTGSVQNASQCEVWFPNVCLLQQHPHTQLILQLYDLGCIIFGNYVQASGAEFPYYIDLRTIISNPQVFEQVLNAYAEILQNLNFDRIAGIPYGSLPTATGLALRLNYPMIFPRKEVKAHGTRRVIEGHFHPGETVVVVDDILISGKSAMEGAAKLKSAGLNVEDIVVFIDHEEGVRDRLKDNGYRAHAVLTLSEITQTLYEAGKIDEIQYQTLTGNL
jgi:uridine monophosphate synthetase